MTKKDLKTGVRVTHKNGITSIFIIDDYGNEYHFTNPENVDWELLWEIKEEPKIEEISADEAMRRLEEQSGKKVKII